MRMSVISKSAKCLLAAAALSLTLSQEARAQTGLKPEQIQARIRGEAEQLVRRGSALVEQPALEFDERRKVMRYSLGAVRSEHLLRSPDDPYRLVYQMQLQTEALRLLFARRELRRDLWEKNLATADLIVLEAVAEIERPACQTCLKEALARKKAFFDAQLDSLDRAMRILALEKGYRPERLGTKGPDDEKFTVRIVKKPEDGRVQVLEWAEFVQCSLRKDCGASKSWRVLLGSEEKMLGDYHYQASWPGGRRGEGDISVEQDKTLTFEPDPRD